MLFINNKTIKYFLFFGLISFVFSCAPSRVVKPLQRGEKRLGGSLGGPLIKYNGGVIPVPYTSVSYAQGITDSLTVYGAIHATSALYGNFQTEIGGTYQIWRNDSNTVGYSGNFTLNTAFNVNAPRNIDNSINPPNSINSFRLWPQIDLNRYWVYNKEKKHMLYYGLSTWIETKARRQSGLRQTAWVFVNPHVGLTLNNNLYNFNFELKYLAPYMNSFNPVVDYVRPVGRYGGLGFYVGITKKLIKKEYIEEIVEE